MARELATVGRRAVIGGLAALAAGCVAVLAASIQAMMAYPGSSLADGYWIGLLPLMALGPWLIVVGASTAIVGGLVILIVAGSLPLRVLALLTTGVAAFWWFVSLAWAGTRCLPNGACSTNDLGAIAYSLPEQTLLFLVLPALLMVVLAWRGRVAGLGRR